MGVGDWEYKYYQSLVEKISQQENVDQILMVGMGDVYDENRIVQAINREKGKKVYSLFIEMVQNIHHHSAVKSSFENMEGEGVVILSNDDQHFILTTGNMVNVSDVSGIVDKIEHLNTLDKEGLRKIYRAQRKLPMEKGKKGSGLGLIHLRRETDLPITIETETINETQSFIVIRALIDKETIHA
jgi:hypothetical protein